MSVVLSSMPLRFGAFTAVSTVFGAGIAAMAAFYPAPEDPFGGAPVFEVVMYRDMGMAAPMAITQPEAAKAKPKSDTPLPALTKSQQTPAAATTTEKLTTRAVASTMSHSSTAMPAVVTVSQSSGQAQAATTAQPSSQTPTRSSQSGDARQGAENSGAQGGAQADDYEARVIRWIDQHKRHPGRVQGLVTLEFVVDRHGRLRRANIANSSGDTRLDQVALAQLREAAPLPKPSRDVDWHIRTMRVQLDYRTFG